MYRYIKIQITLFVSLFILTTAFPQVELVPYSKDFVFKEGIYLNFQQFLQNNPVELKNIAMGYDKSRLDFLTNTTSKKEIVYLEADKKTIVSTDDIWGYCQNQIVYIRYNDEFSRVPLIGTVCHFLGPQIVRTGYSSTSPYDYPYGYSQVVKQQTQLIFDTQTAKVMPFDSNTMEIILQCDMELYQEFMALKPRKRKQSLFIYLRKFNEKYPLHLES